MGKGWIKRECKKIENLWLVLLYIKFVIHTLNFDAYKIFFDIGCQQYEIDVTYVYFNSSNLKYLNFLQSRLFMHITNRERHKWSTVRLFILIYVVYHVCSTECIINIRKN